MAMKDHVASKIDLAESEGRMMKAAKAVIKEEISTSVHPLRNKMAELRGRLTAVKVRARTSSSLHWLRSSIVDKANRQIALTRFPAALSLDSHTKEIEQFLSFFNDVPGQSNRDEFSEREKNAMFKSIAGIRKVRKPRDGLF
eukprot:1716823-Pyramimonas_sp.AAC.1